MYDLKSQHRSSLSTRLQRARVQIREVGVKFDTNRDLLVEAQLTAPNLVVNATDERVIGTRAITVVRVQKGKSVTLDADEAMQLLPGDVLTVQRSALPASLGRSRFPVRGLGPSGASDNLLTPTGAAN